MKLSTQADKTADAMEILQKLVDDMPVRSERIDAVKQTIRNLVNNEYPSGRSMSLKIASYRREGYEYDPNEGYLRAIQDMEMDDILRFYKDYIQGHPIVYAIVGNSKMVDMKRLATFGKIIKVTKKDIYV